MPPPNTPEEGVPLNSRGRRRGNSQARPRPESQQHSQSQRSRSSSRPSASTSRGSSTSSRSAQSSASTLEFDYQSLEYTESVDDTLLCPICHTPFYKPVTTKNCGHTFCAGCLRRAVEIQRVCPVDRQPFHFTAEELCNTRIIGSQLDRLKVKCPNKACKHVTIRGLVTAHYQRDCEYTLVDCPDPTCPERIQRMDALPANGCLHRDTACLYCGDTVQIAKLEEHYDNNCSSHTSKCPHCNAMVVRHQMQHHLLYGCPEALTRCKWRRHGCALHTKRRIVEEHEQNGCIYQAIGQLVQEKNQDRITINRLKDQVDSLENQIRLMDLENSNRMNASSAGMHRRRYPDMGFSNGPGTNQPSYGLDSPDDYMLTQFERLEGNMEALSKRVNDLDARNTNMLFSETMSIKNQIAELRSTIGVFSMQTSWLMSAFRQIRAHVSGRANTSATGAGGAGASGGDDAFGPNGRMHEGRADNLPRL